MADDKKETAYSILKGERDTAVQENVKLSARVQELWEKAAELDLQVLDKQKENEALKAKYDALNEVSRQNLAKKNFTGEQLQKLESENEKLLRQNGALISENAQIEKLNEIKTGLESEVLGFKNHCINLNDSLSASEQNLKELNLQVEALKKSEADLKKSLQLLNGASADLKTDNENLKAVSNDLRSEIDDLNWENAAFKKQYEKWNLSKMSFTILVSLLAVFANFVHVGSAYLDLTAKAGEIPDTLHKWTAYGAVFVFDLAIFLFTLNNEKNTAKYFAIGVFLICFFALGSPFSAWDMVANVDLALIEKYKTLLFWKNAILGLILSAMFAFIPYSCAELFKKQ